MVCLKRKIFFAIFLKINSLNSFRSNIADQYLLNSGCTKTELANLSSKQGHAEESTSLILSSCFHIQGRLSVLIEWIPLISNLRYNDPYNTIIYFILTRYTLLLDEENIRTEDKAFHVLSSRSGEDGSLENWWRK